MHARTHERAHAVTQAHKKAIKQASEQARSRAHTRPNGSRVTRARTPNAGSTSHNLVQHNTGKATRLEMHNLNLSTGLRSTHPHCRACRPHFLKVRLLASSALRLVWCRAAPCGWPCCCVVSNKAAVVPHDIHTENLEVPLPAHPRSSANAASTTDTLSPWSCFPYHWICR